MTQAKLTFFDTILAGLAVALDLAGHALDALIIMVLGSVALFGLCAFCGKDLAMSLGRGKSACLWSSTNMSQCIRYWRRCMVRLRRLVETHGCLTRGLAADSRLTLLKLLLWVRLLLLFLLLLGLFIIAVISASLPTGLVALLVGLATLLLVLLVDLGLLAGLLVGTGRRRLRAGATLDWRLIGVGRGVGERLPDVGKEVGETHCECSGGNFGVERTGSGVMRVGNGRELGEVHAGIAKMDGAKPRLVSSNYWHPQWTVGRYLGTPRQGWGDQICCLRHCLGRLMVASSLAIRGAVGKLPAH